MALIYNGSQVNSLIYNGNETTGMWNGNVVWGGTQVDPYNPLGLPPNTVRVRTSDGAVPYKITTGWNQTTYETATLVEGTTDVYDVYKSGDFGNFLYGSTNVVAILGANLQDAPIMGGAFDSCVNVKAGALALYNQLISQPNQVTSHIGTFYNCGRDTVNGAAELAQIPSDWK